MIPITLSYSNNDGVSFSTPLAIEALKLRVTEVNETDNATNAVTGRRYPRKFTYLQVDLETHKKCFDPSDPTWGANANNAWAELENICAAKLIRLVNTNTTGFPLLDGHNEFNSGSNTNYLLLENQSVRFDDMDGTASGRRLRYMILEFRTRDAI